MLRKGIITGATQELRAGSYAQDLSVWLWLGLGVGGCLSLALCEQLRTAGFLHPTRHGVI